MPQVLEDIKQKIIEKNLSLSNDHLDGRINSALNETQIIESIEAEFSIIKPGVREWFDFIAVDGNKKYPVNIKVSNLEGNDNVQCKLGIYYSVTGIWPDFSNQVSWESFFSKVELDLNKNENKDYYFIVVSKVDPADIILTSLKKIRHLVPNGNNLPFQCRWGSNRVTVDRTHEQATKFILSTLGKSCDLRANIKSEFEKHIAKHL